MWWRARILMTLMMLTITMTMMLVLPAPARMCDVDMTNAHVRQRVKQEYASTPKSTHMRWRMLNPTRDARTMCVCDRALQLAFAKWRARTHKANTFARAHTGKVDCAGMCACVRACVCVWGELKPSLCESV